MRWRRILTGVVTASLIGIGLLSGSGATQVAQAASLAAPHLTSKQILGETSIDGPGLTKNIVGHEGEATMVLAWTGTDSLHRLNLLTSANGSTWTNKRTLRETSFIRPAVERVPEMAGGEVVLAWMGTDARHTLNVLWNAYNNGNSIMKKVTFWGDMSFTAPALAMSGDRIYVVWAGTDPSHSLNIMTLAPRTLKVIAIKRYLPFSTNSRPSISLGSSNSLLLSWTNRSGQLAFAIGDATLRFGAAKVSTDTSFAGPDFFYAFSGYIGDVVTPKYWWAWTGKDANHTIHIAFNKTTDWPPASNKATLGEWALGGPELGWRGLTFTVVLVWAGTDPGHHLNVGRVSAA
ncbi:MAG TPA: hypothetical protein VGF38_16035 [Ktedonobacterales bacterium]|jgi:hypothetical protein